MNEWKNVVFTKTNLLQFIKRDSILTKWTFKAQLFTHCKKMS